MTEVPSGYAGLHPLWQDEIGTTYAAQDAAGGPDTGLRVLRVSLPGRPERRRFRGACLAVTVMTPHPGILTLHEVDFTADHHPFLVTDLPQGNLAGRIASTGPLSLPAAAAVGQALAATLGAAHDNGLLHQDVRPENVVWAAGPAPLLTDFGVTRAALDAGAGELSPPSLVHAAREIFGWETPGPPADVYGLASTIYTMLAGHAPYHAEALLGRAALYQRVLRGAPPPVPAPGIPVSCSALLADMMAPDPASRPSTSEVVEALAEFAAMGGTGAAWQPLPVPPPPQASVIPLTATSPTDAPAPALTQAAMRQAHLGQAHTGQAPTDRPRATVGPSQAPADLSQTMAPPGSAIAQALAPPRPSGALTAAPSAPALPRSPGPASSPATPDGRKRLRYTGLVLLIAIGVVALLAGIVWGAATAPGPRPVSAPTANRTAAAAPLPPGEQASYRPRRVSVTSRAAGIMVSWAAPLSTADVTAYIVIAEKGSQAAQEQTIAAASHHAVFIGLLPGVPYCFVVGSLLEPATGQPATAAAAPVCTTVRS